MVLWPTWGSVALQPMLMRWVMGWGESVLGQPHGRVNLPQDGDGAISGQPAPPAQVE